MADKGFTIIGKKATGGSGKTANYNLCVQVNRVSITQEAAESVGIGQGNRVFFLKAANGRDWFIQKTDEEDGFEVRAQVIKSKYGTTYTRYRFGNAGLVEYLRKAFNTPIGPLHIPLGQKDADGLIPLITAKFIPR